MKKYKIIISYFISEDIEKIQELYIHAIDRVEAEDKIKLYIDEPINIISVSLYFEGY